MEQGLLSELLSRVFAFDEDWTLTPLHGGDINRVFLIRSGAGSFVLKHNDHPETPGLFEAEAYGLTLLKQASPPQLMIPEVIGFQELGDSRILVLEYLPSASPSAGFWSDFGRALAALHQPCDQYAGLERDNYIATLRQDNTAEESWPRFFAERRIRPMARTVERKLGSDLMRKLGSVCDRMDQLIPNDPVSLLHGDLWSGNYLCLGERAALIDPAVYRGSREMDLAMTRLFGGFPDEFYRAYMEVSPLTEGWEERVDLCNLYPVLVHVNLFGGGYVSQLSHMLDKYV